MNQPAKVNLTRKQSIKVKFLDEHDMLCIEYFVCMQHCFDRLEEVLAKRGGEYFPTAITVITEETF